MTSKFTPCAPISVKATPKCYAKKDKLFFGFGNSKLNNSIATFSIPAGYTCPFAKDCLSKANPLTGKIIDGKHCQFRCFAASQECTYPNVRNVRWKNFNILKEGKSVDKMAQIIQYSLPDTRLVRIHVSGDYYNENYFLAWLNVALNNPGITFYGYTKALPLIVKYRKYIPFNFRLIASKGGTHDHLIKKHDLISAEVVFSVNEAEDKGLLIDHDDSLAISSVNSFALLLHGIQPANSKASEALKKLRRQGLGGYSKEKKELHYTQKKPFYVFLDLNNKGRIRRQSKLVNIFGEKDIV